VSEALLARGKHFPCYKYNILVYLILSTLSPAESSNAVYSNAVEAVKHACCVRVFNGFHISCASRFNKTTRPGEMTRRYNIIASKEQKLVGLVEAMGSYVESSTERQYLGPLIRGGP
jgi:hypothetical protein